MFCFKACGNPTELTEWGFQGNHPDKSHSASNGFVNKCLCLTYIHSMSYPQDASPILFRCIVHSLCMSGSGWEWNLNHSLIRGACFCKTWLQIMSISLLAKAAFTVSRTDKTLLIYRLFSILLLISWHILSSLAKQIFRQFHEQATRAKWMKPSPCTFVQELMGKMYSKSFSSP